MENIKKRLSDYIDRLNEEKKPQAHGNHTETSEMEELMNTVRKIRSLKEPTLPEADYPEKLAESVAKQLSAKSTVKKIKRTLITATAAVAAVVVLVFTLSSILYPRNTDIVYAMEQAFQEVKAYHGIIEIVESNSEGKETTQAIREVWADKEGKYYVKELEGSQSGLITANNGEKKWQQRPDEKQVFVFPAFPDPYQFSFELGKEINNVKNATEINTIGEDIVSNRAVKILEVTPKGGQPYRIWVDKESKLPLKRECAMLNSIQYTTTYTSIYYCDALPEELLAYCIPEGFEEINKNPEQLVNNIEELKELTGFTPRIPVGIHESFKRDSISLANSMKTVKLNYTSQDKHNRVIVLQGKTEGELIPATTAVLGTVNGNVK
jgi:outer membrane lipoprotein-sorting protein